VSWSQYISENRSVALGIGESDLSKFVLLLKETRAAASKVWVLGNGGSASTAAHAVGDFGKTVKGFGGAPIFTIAPSEMTALQTAYANDVDFKDGFSETLRDFASQGDLVWIISVSGRSPNLLKAVEVSKSKGLKVVATVGERGAGLESEVDLCIVIPSDDYQIVENIQLEIMHWLTKQLD
jgi:D-sedoheptulose 7-phosphate isomerase